MEMYYDNMNSRLVNQSLNSMKSSFNSLYIFPRDKKSSFHVILSGACNWNIPY